MRLNKYVKVLGIALPLAVLAACTSTPKDGMAGGDQTSMQTDGTGVQMGSAAQMMNANEQMMQKLQHESTVFFKFDNAVIADQYKDTLQAHATYLMKNPSVKVTIEGNTDERGTPEYNIALGERRANAVAKYLETLGVPASQISVVSYGEEKPVAAGRTAADFEQNRRAVIVY